MKRGIIFTVDALFALALVLLLVNLYITHSAAAKPNETGNELLAKDKAITAFYKGQALGGQNLVKGENYYCYKVVRRAGENLVAEKQCEDLP